MDAEITIIGAGVIGLAIAEKTSEKFSDVFVIEKHTTFGQETKVRKTLEDIRTQVFKSDKTVDENVLFKPGNETYVTSYIGILLSDTTADVRSRGVSAAARVASGGRSSRR